MEQEERPPGAWPARAIGVGIALVAALAIYWSPLGFEVARAAVLPPHVPPVSARELYYMNSAPSRVDLGALARARAAAPAGHTDLVLMGSSELNYQGPFSPADFLRHRVSDFDLFDFGQYGDQSLSHAVELSALSSKQQLSKVALIVSPQWFAGKGVNPEAFQHVMSSTLAQGLLDDHTLTPQTRARLISRSAAMWQDDAWFPHSPRPPSGDVDAAWARRFGVLKDAWATSRATSNVTTGFDVPIDAAPIDSMDWDAEESAARQAAAAAKTNNEFGIDDRFFDDVYRPRLDALRASNAKVDYSGTSREWDDLALFLDVAREHHIKVLLILQPMNGRWYDYTAYPKERRALFYDRLRDLARRAGVEFLDTAAHEYDADYMIDSMHFGWKGWLDVIHRCATFARS